MAINKKIVLKVLGLILWLAITGVAIFLLVAASRSSDAKLCSGVNISIKGPGNNLFIDEADILAYIKTEIGGKPEGRRLNDFNLRAMESHLEKNDWVSDADIYIDKNDVLQVEVEVKEPVARVFANNNGSFYIDSLISILPLSEKLSARVPVFTGFTGNPARLNRADSAMLSSIKVLSSLIVKDSFLMAMIDQVDITPQRSFQLLPKFGKQIIEFGDSSQAPAKFEKLKLFYKNIVSKSGWDKYSFINLTYANQVVAKLRGKEDIAADSLRTKELLELMAFNAAMMAADSAKLNSHISEKAPNDVSMIDQSVERDDVEDDGQPVPAIQSAPPTSMQQSAPPTQAVVPPKPQASAAPAPKPAASAAPRPAQPKPTAKPVAPKPKPVVVKPTAAVPKPNTEPPRAVMPPKNEND